MASSEKQTIPLEDIPVTDEGIPELQSSTTDLVDVKLPSRPRRKAVIIAGVIAVLIVVVVAASLIGKYVPEYLSEANSKSEKGSKDKGTGESEGSIHSSSASETKPSAKATSSHFQRGQTYPPSRMTSLTSTATTSSMSEAPTIMSTVSVIRLASSVTDQTVITNLVTDTVATSSLKTKTKSSAKATSSHFQPVQTSPLPRMTSLTSAATTSSMSEAPTIMSTVTQGVLTSS